MTKPERRCPIDGSAFRRAAKTTVERRRSRRALSQRKYYEMLLSPTAHGTQIATAHGLLLTDRLTDWCVTL